MSTRLHVALSAVLVSLLVSPTVATAKPRTASSTCGAVTMSVSVEGRDALLKVAFESTCPDLDLEAEAQLWVDGQLVGQPVTLDAQDHVEILASLTAADPAIPRQVCLEVIGVALREQGRKIVSSPLAEKACQVLVF